MEKNVLPEENKNIEDKKSQLRSLTKLQLTAFFDGYFKLKEFADAVKVRKSMPCELADKCQEVIDGYASIDLGAIDTASYEKVLHLTASVEALQKQVESYPPEETDPSESVDWADGDESDEVNSSARRRSTRISIVIAIMVLCVVSVVLATLVPVPWVQNAMGCIYYYGRVGEVDYTEAEKWFRRGAEAGYAKAQYNLGMCYDTGHGIKQDYVEAVIWYRKAAEQDHALAQLALGKCLEEGLGVETANYKEAVYWYEKAARQDIPEAQYRMALYYDKSEDIEDHYKKAYRYFLRAAKQEHTHAQCWVGLYLERGLGTEKDQEEAIKWYRKAVEKGDSRAQYCLALSLIDDEHSEDDELEAADLMRQAANSGFSEAQYEMGRFYENGIGVKESRKQALRWYIKAAEKRHSKARKAIERLEIAN